MKIISLTVVAFFLIQSAFAAGFRWKCQTTVLSLQEIGSEKNTKELILKGKQTRKNIKFKLFATHAKKIINQGGATEDVCYSTSIQPRNFIGHACEHNINHEGHSDSFIHINNEQAKSILQKYGVEETIENVRENANRVDPFHFGMSDLSPKKSRTEISNFYVKGEKKSYQINIECNGPKEISKNTPIIPLSIKTIPEEVAQESIRTKREEERSVGKAVPQEKIPPSVEKNATIQEK